MRRAVGYVRVSTESQTEGYGLDVQKQRIIDFAREHDYDLIGVEADPGVTGMLPLYDRPGLTGALAIVRQRQGDPFPVDAVIVARFDRLGRDTLESLLAEREFGRFGARVLYGEGMNGDDPQQRFMRTVLHGVAQLDRDMLIARMRAGREAKKAAGLYSGGRPRFGFRPEGDRLVPMRDSRGELEAEAKLVAWIFLRIAKDRWTTRKVAAHLNERRALGVKWDSARVTRILKCADYKLGERPIVDPRVWNRAQTVLASRRRNRVPTAA